MSDRIRTTDRTGLDRLIEAAARRSLPALADEDAAIREALVAGRARLRSASRRRGIALAVALTASVVFVAAIQIWPHAPSPTVAAAARVVPPEVAPIAVATPSAAPSTLALGEEHHIHTMPGTDLALESRDRLDTTLRLNYGAALFDVGPLHGGTFSVRTPDSQVRVHGTVFAVTVASGQTRVEVFEGRVEVQDRHGTRMLAIGESYTSGTVIQTPTALAERGAEAALRRASIAPEPPRRATAPTITLATLRAMLERGEYQTALDAMRGAIPPAAEQGDWAMVEGDAERALGHSAQAARVYGRAVTLLTPTRAALAGFLAAVQYERAGEIEESLAVLDRAHAADRGSPLEERAVALRATLLMRLDRVEEAHTAARAYLASFPGGEARARMRALLDPE